MGKGKFSCGKRHHGPFPHHGKRHGHHHHHHMGPGFEALRQQGPKHHGGGHHGHFGPHRGHFGPQHHKQWPKHHNFDDAHWRFLKQLLGFDTQEKCGAPKSANGVDEDIRKRLSWLNLATPPPPKKKDDCQQAGPSKD